MNYYITGLLEACWEAKKTLELSGLRLQLCEPGSSSSGPLFLCKMTKVESVGFLVPSSLSHL